MAVNMVNPEELIAPQGYAHVAVASGSKIVHVAGQVSEDRDGHIVGEGDLTQQTQGAVHNVVTALGAVGASYADVVDVRMYVPGLDESKFEQLVAGFRNAAATLQIDPVKPGTLIGVASLARPGWLIEIAVTAVIE